MRVLLSAFGCDPHFGSDEEVGWQWACELAAQGHTVTVLTRASHRSAIEAEQARGAASGVHFAYVDAPRLHRLLARVNRRNHLYYIAWQWLALQRARQLQQAQGFDRIHHVTWVSFRQPSFLGALGVPMVFGPVAGGDTIPPALLGALSAKQRLFERLRSAVNALVRVDPWCRRTYAQAQHVVVTSPAHLALLPASARGKTHIALAVAVPQQHVPARGLGLGTRMLFVGRAIGLKGLDLGLPAFAQARRTRPDLTLTVLSEGPELVRWQALAAHLGVAEAVRWLPWCPKAALPALYAAHDVLLNPSLRDSGGLVVLEALQAGLPVVCLALGGPGVVVDGQVGEAVPATGTRHATEQALAAALLRVGERSRTQADLSAAAQARAALHNWPALVARLVALPVR